MDNIAKSAVQRARFQQWLCKLNAGWLLRAIGCAFALCGQAMATSLTNSLGLSVALDASGNYTVNSTAPAWTFAGSVGTTPTTVATNSGTDNVGAYSEMTFGYVSHSGVSQTAGIRLYGNTPAILFTHTYLAASTNDLAFPNLTTYPTNLYQIGFKDVAFGFYGFGAYAPDSPWVFFDTNFNSFVISPATNYMIASDLKLGNGSIICGLNSAITNLPAGFRHQAILVVQNGINNSFNTWGNTLTSLSGKTRPANDAAIELQKLGYWTDNGATYYYNYVANLGYPGTLQAVKNEFATNGLPLGYMQLDSWWYPKGASDSWQGDPTNNRGGVYQYVAAPALFTNGLSAFQQQLDMPLVTHCRWIDPASPYNSQYAMSAEVCVDPRFWSNILGYIKSGGVATFEHDWLSGPAVPLMNLNDPPAFMNNMAAAASSNGINMQYCMPEPRHYLQGSLYNNLLTTRVANDHFTIAANGIGEWNNFLYDSRLASALGAWPWTDVYNSVNLRDLLIGTLSAGPVGVGDALGTESFTNLLQAVRQDSVIVKPDVPLLALDQSYLNDVQGLNLPMVASTYTDHNGLRDYYVFAYARTAANLTASLNLNQLGVTNNAFVYDYFNQTGLVVTAGSTFVFPTTLASDTTGGSYFVVAPIGASGIGLVGDMNKFATAGRQRISALSDSTGGLAATVTFATGESNVTLVGYGAFAPLVTSSNGSAMLRYYSSHQFAIAVSPDGSGTATVLLSAASNNLPQVATPAISPGSTVYAGTNVSFTESLLPAWNDAPFTYQWQSNNINIGSAINTNSATNSVSVATTGFASGSYNYRVIVSNADGSVTSAPVVLSVVVPGPATDFTLNFGGTPMVEATGNDWDTLNVWNPGGQAASTTEVSNPGSTYEVVVGSRLRSPAGTASNLFPGVQLAIDGGGVFENGTLNAVGELRLKNNNTPSTNYFTELVLNGGQLDLGDNTYEVVQGQVNVARNSSIYIDSSSANDRAYQIDAWLTGSGNLFWHQCTGALGGTNLQITCSSNTFNGQWFVDQGALVGAGANSLGTNNIYVGLSGLTAAVETLYDIQNPGGSLILGANGRVFLHQNDHFNSVTVNGVALTNGTYPFATLNRSYPANFPASWVLQSGSSINGGSGQINVLSTPPVLGPGLTNFTLNFGGVPIVEGLGADWNTVNSWNPGGQAASVTANSSNTYEVVVGSRLRTPAGTNNNFFPGAQLTIDGSGVLENATLNAVGELRFKSNYSAATNHFNELVLHGGQLDNGANNGNYLLVVVQGAVQVTSNSTIYVDATAGVDRGYQIDAWLAGSGTLLWHEFSGGLGGVDLAITGVTNTFSGQWIVDQGALVGVGVNSLGTNNLVVGTGTNFAAVETLYDINNTNGSLIIGTNGRVFLHRNDHFASVIVNGVALANGTYSFATLNSTYPANFPASWTPQAGSTSTTGSGQIIVGNGPPASPHITSAKLYGSLLSISATNGSAGGVWTMLQSTNLALPLSQWQTNCAGRFDGSGNLSTNIVNPASSAQEFYLLKVQ